MSISNYVSRGTVTNLFKQLYLPRIRAQYYNQTPVAGRIRKRVKDEDFQGKKALIAAHLNWAESVGAGGEGDRLPEPHYDEIVNMEVDVVRNRGRIRVDRMAIAASRSNAGAWSRLLEFTMKSVRENLIFDVSRQMVYGDGSGKLAQVAGAVASGGTINVDNPGTRLLRKNMGLAFFNGSTEEDAGTTHRIGDVTSDTQFTLAANLGAGISDNAWIYRKSVAGVGGVSSKDKEMMGLAGIIDDGTRVANFQGLARSSNPWLKCNVLSNGGTNRALTLPLVDQAFFKAEESGGGGWPTAIYSKHSIARKYADLLRAERRYVNTMKLDGGWSALEYTSTNGAVPWIGDRMCRDNEVWFCNEEDLGYWILSPLDWVDDDGAVVSRRADYDEVEAYLVEYAQFGAHRCNRHTALKDILES